MLRPAIHCGRQVISTCTGISFLMGIVRSFGGSILTSETATDTGNFSVLLAATVVMAATVVTINRLVWRRLYALASTRFKLEG